MCTALEWAGEVWSLPRYSVSIKAKGLICALPQTSSFSNNAWNRLQLRLPAGCWRCPCCFLHWVIKKDFNWYYICIREMCSRKKPHLSSDFCPNSEIKNFLFFNKKWLSWLLVLGLTMRPILNIKKKLRGNICRHRIFKRTLLKLVILVQWFSSME